MTFFALALSPLEVSLLQRVLRQLDPGDLVPLPLPLLAMAAKAAVLVLPLLLVVVVRAEMAKDKTEMARMETAKTATSDLEPSKALVKQTVLPETSLVLLRFLASLESRDWLTSCRHTLSMGTKRMNWIDDDV